MPYEHCNSAEPPGNVVALLNRYKMILRTESDPAKKPDCGAVLLSAFTLKKRPPWGGLENKTAIYANALPRL